MAEPNRQEGRGRADAGEEVVRLDQLLDRVEAAAKEKEQTSIGDVVEHVGARSFGPLLLVAGLVMVAPVVGDIPGVPVLMGLVVILIAGQLLFRRDEIWLPRWLQKRSVQCGKVRKSVDWLRRPARFVDRWTRSRYTRFVKHAGAYVIAATCVVIAAATPVMEVVPFSANFAGIAITAFGLALIAQDGLLALVAIAFCLVTVGLLVYQFI